MIAEKMQKMVKNSSAIRAMFEEGNRLAKIYGKETVFDFSLGNPNVPAPQAVKDAIWESRIPSDHDSAYAFMMQEAERMGLVKP